MPEAATFDSSFVDRFAALRQVGGFHPYLTAEEEGEIIGRLRAAGYRTELTPELMITHFTTRKDSWPGTRRRIARGMVLGTGQVLRVALRDGLFTYHARRHNRALVTLAYLLVAAALAVAVPFGAPGWLELSWLAFGIIAFMALWWRHGAGMRSALYIAGDWLFGAIGIVLGFLRPPPDPRKFEPRVEIVRAGATAPAAERTSCSPSP